MEMSERMCVRTVYPRNQIHVRMLVPSAAQGISSTLEQGLATTSATTLANEFAKYEHIVAIKELLLGYAFAGPHRTSFNFAISIFF